MLVDCHERLRVHAELAFRAAYLGVLTEAERLEIFTRVERYFRVELPRHVEDEDVSLGTRLRTLELSRDLENGLEDMERQHRAIEVLVDSLLPRWRLLRQEPGRHGELSREMLRDTGLLVARLVDHFWLEEHLLFPEARARLSPEMLADIAAEMRARRGEGH
jgi:hypothetical protein